MIIDNWKLKSKKLFLCFSSFFFLINCYSQNIQVDSIIKIPIDSLVDTNLNGLFFIDSSQFMFSSDMGVYCYNNWTKKIVTIKKFDEKKVVFKIAFNKKKRLFGILYFNSELEIYQLDIDNFSLKTIGTYSDSSFLNLANSLMFNMNGDKIAIGSSKGILRVLNIVETSISRVLDLELNGDLIWSACFDAKDEKIFAGCPYGIVYECDIKSKKVKKMDLKFKTDVTSIVPLISKEGTLYLACDERNVSLFNIKGKRIKTYNNSSFSNQILVAPPNTNFFVIGNLSYGQITFFNKTNLSISKIAYTKDYLNNELIESHKLESIEYIDFSTDGKYMVVADNAKQIFLFALQFSKTSN